MKESRILVVTNTINDSKEGVSAKLQEDNGLVDMPDWVLDEIIDDKSINAISTLLVDLKTMGPGFMLKESDFIKSISFGDNKLSDEQVMNIYRSLLRHGIVVDLDLIVKNEHPDWSEDKISNAVSNIYNGGKAIE